MFNKILSSLLFLILVSFMWESCKKEVLPEPIDKPLEEEKPINPNEVIINEKAIIVTTQTNDNLISVTDTELKFSATQSSLQLENVQVGSYLVSGIHSNAPGGYLRKVIAIQKASDYSFLTESASLTDVVNQGFLDGEYAYADNASNHVSFSLNEVLYDVDNNHSTTNDQVRLVGALDLIPTLYLEADWAFPNNLKRLKVGYKMQKIANLQLTGQAILPTNYSVEKLVLRKPFPPIQFFIGSLPVVVTSEAILKAGISANGSVAFNIAYNENSMVDSYVEKPNGVGLNDFQNWISSTTKTQSSNLNQSSLVDYDLNFNGDLPYVKAELIFYLYNSSNIKTTLSATAALNVHALCSSSTANCDFDIDLKLKGCFDVDLKLMNFSLVNNTFCPYVNQFDIWETSPSGGTSSGCTDTDSPDYSFNATTDDGSCRYAYLNKVELIDFNPQDGGSNWDSGVGSVVNPDIIVRLKKSSASVWGVETAAVENCSAIALPASTTTSLIKLTDESWTLEFLDEDLYFNDQMGVTTFNPIDIIRVNNVNYVDISASGNTARLYFTIQ